MTIQRMAQRGVFMARITVTLPDNLYNEVLSLAGKENDSLSFTTSRLIEIGLMVMNNKNEKGPQEIEAYCQKLIIQINGIIKEIAVNKFNFDNEKILQITNETISKFNQITGAQPSGL